MIKNLNSMTKKELIEALQKEINARYEHGKEKMELQSQLSSQAKTIEELKKDKEELKKDAEKLKKTKEELEEKYRYSVEQIKVLLLQQYGKGRTKLKKVSEEQLSLFSNVFEDEPEQVKIENEEVVEVPSYKRKKAKKEQHIDYSHLPHKVIVHEPKEAVTCEMCGNPMHIYKYEEKEELVYIPAQVYVAVHKIPYYECKHCTDMDGSSLHTHLDLWKPLIPKSKASSSLLAALIDYKYNLGLPYFAIEKKFEEDNIIIPRANMTNWVMGIMKYIDPLYDLMRQDLLTKPIIACDETPMYVLKEENRPARSTSYLWQYKTCNNEDDISIFEYQASRSGDVVRKALEGFSGILLTDKYAGYSKVESATRAYCHAHAYRYLRESYEILPDKARRGSLEGEALKRYQKVFEIDRKIHEAALKKYPNDNTGYYQYIQENRAKTLAEFESFLTWLQSIKDQVVLKMKFLSAINYILNDGEGFKVFMKDPRIELTNNGAERNFRKWCVNRTRSKFYVSTRGAEAAAKIYSLMITAKNNGYNIFAYFDYLFDHIRYENLEDKETLRKYLPYKDKIPSYCKLKTNKEIKQRLKELNGQSND